MRYWMDLYLHELYNMTPIGILQDLRRVKVSFEQGARFYKRYLRQTK